MNSMLSSLSRQFKLDSRLERIVEEAIARLQAGEAVDVDALAAAHPEYAADLQDLLSTATRLVRMGGSGRGDAASTPLDADPHEVAGDNGAVGEDKLATARFSVRNEQLGDFRLLREIGRGGMGVVYEAEQLSLGRRVALKVLPFAAMLDKQQLKRFKNEARAAATLDHPNIVAVHSVGEERGVHYYAMQLVEGESLAQVIERMRQERVGSRQSAVGSETSAATEFSRDAKVPRSGARPPGEIRNAECGVRNDGADATISRHSAIRNPQSALDTAPLAALSTRPDGNPREHFRTIARLGVQAAEALDHAHASGVVHRDVKPANLLVECSHLAPRDESSRLAERDGYKLWVTDFGLARIEQDAGLTMTGDLLGTLRYMSPEQTQGSAAVLDRRTDVYSLGATLYELLALVPAFDATDRRELLRQINDVEPRSLSRLNSAIPTDLETIVLKAMSKDAASRYGTAQQMADDLRRFLEHKPIEARRPTLGERGRKWARRHAALTAISAAALALTTLAFAGAALIAVRAFKSETRERAAAESNLVLAADAIDRTLSRIVHDRYVDGDVEDAETAAIDATEFYERLLEHTSDPGMQFRAASAYHDVGRIWMLIRRHEESKLANVRRLELLNPLVAAFPDRPDYLDARAEAYVNIGLAEFHLNQLRAEEPLRLASADLHYLIDRFPDEPTYKAHLAVPLHSLGNLSALRGRWDDALDSYRRVSEITSRLPADMKNSREQLTRQAELLGSMSLAARGRGESESAKQYFVSAAALEKRLIDAWPDFSLPGDFLYEHFLDSAYTSFRAGQLDAAASDVGTLAWAFSEQMKSYHDAAVLLLRCAAAADADDGDRRYDADSYRERARAMAAKAHEAPVRTREETSAFALFLLTCRDESLRDPPRALELARGVMKKSPGYARGRMTLALAHYRMGNWQAASDALSAPAEFTFDDREASYIWALLSMVRARQGRFDEARRLHAKASDWIAKNSAVDETLWDLVAEAEDVVNRD